MKTKYLYITGIIFMGFLTPVSAQNQVGDFDGFQSSLNYFAEAAAETYESLKQKYNEYVRLGMLMGSDIRMKMKAEFKGQNIGEQDYDDSQGYMVDNSTLFWVKETDTEGELYAEFDWQNMSEKMHLTSTEGFSQFGIKGTPIYGEKTIEAQDFNMFIDPLGYWYIPSGDLKGWGSDADYLRVNPMGGMSNVAKMLEVGIQDAIDAKAGEMLDKLAVLAIIEAKNNEWLTDFIPKEMIDAYTDPDPDKSYMEEKLKPVLQELAKLQFEQITGFPAFIHFAFIISPTLVRSSFNVNEETITFEGQPVLTKMTVTSGSDAGYLIMFDEYGRLIHLRDTDGATADYWYDKDVAVNIPPAASINLDVLMQLSQPGVSDK